MSSKLFSPFKLRNLEFKNRIVVSPMCQYSAIDGIPNDWHLVHLGSRASGGAGVVMCEATGVSAVGRISPGDIGIWNESQVEAFRPITAFIKSQGSIPAIQLAHAGRKASTDTPWTGRSALNKDNGGWEPLAPSAIPFDEGWITPKQMTESDIAEVVSQFTEAATNALTAGFQIAEVHAAHGYLLHEFLSPLSNQRKDSYGGTIENRMRFPLQVAKAVREVWPPTFPVFVRISASDWVDGGWTIDDSVVLSKKLKDIGIDLVDCSSGGNAPKAKIPVGPGYQVPFSDTIRRDAGIATGAVGMITEAHQADTILQEGKADLVFLARELLRDPYWPLHAAKVLGDDVAWPKQYERAKR